MRYCLIILYGFISFVLQAQNRDTLLMMLEQELQAGHTRALRDLGSLIDTEPRALALLQNYTLFQDREFQWERASKNVFLNFYYQTEQDIKFSPLLDAFYLSPIESWNVQHVIRSKEQAEVNTGQLRLLIRDYELSISQGNNTAFKILQEIADLKTKESNQFLINLLGTLPSSKPTKSQQKLRLFINQQLAQSPLPENMGILLQQTQKGHINFTEAQPLLTRLTNVKINSTNSKMLIEGYKHLLDSLGNIQQIRQYGYDKLFDFRIPFFQFPVDYYGKILSQSEKYPWIHQNALQDIQATEHPRALFYIAAQIHQFRNRPDWIYTAQDYRQLLNEITQLDLAIPNKKGVLEFNYNLNQEPITRQNYVIYWATQYEDFEWDMVRKTFINKNQAVAQTEVYERLFRRLNSSNDSVAIESYIVLTQGDPIEVLNLAKKYKDLLRSYNKKLPSFKNQFLEQLVQLTHFCTENGFSYEPSESLKNSLSLLLENLSPSERYSLENQLINSLTMQDISAVEYMGLLKSNNSEFSFSIGRILDHFYSQTWEQILNNEDFLRLYLKKAHLFQEIGVIGVCNNYFYKFQNLNADFKQKLTALNKVENDLDILRGLNKLLAGEENVENLQAFYEDPLSVSKDDLENLPSLKPSDYPLIRDLILDSENSQVTKRLFSYIALHLKIELVPYLMDLLIQEVSENQVAKLLKNIYSFKFSPREWLMQWQMDGGNFLNWSETFFQEKLNTIKTSPSISIKDINAVAESPHYTPDLKETILLALKKVKSIKQIRRLKMTPKLSLETDLKYFADFEFSYKELDDVPKLFELDKPQLMVNYLEEKLQNFSPEEKGSFYNNLLRSNWYINYVNDGQLSVESSNRIINILQTYLNESDLISEFEEQATIRNIMLLTNTGKSLSEKLETTIALDADASSKAKIQEAIIARVSYKQIPEVMEYFDKLSEAFQYNFLNKDFGLPIFELENVQIQQQIIKDHWKMKPEEFYRHYLSAFGVDYLKENGQLDYQKIYNILQFDIVNPFVGGGGSIRDYFAYGIIKLLEFEFKSRLGYHPKLNENQTFYSFSASKRATAWINFLLEKGLVKEEKIPVSSFVKER